MCRVGNPQVALLLDLLHAYLPKPSFLDYHGLPLNPKACEQTPLRSVQLLLYLYIYIVDGATTPVAITLKDLPFSPLHPCFPSQHSITMAFSIWAKRLNGHHGHP